MSRNSLATLLLAVILGAVSGGVAGYFAARIDSAKTVSEDEVRTAILARPEMIEEAFYALQAKRQAKAEEQKAKALAQSGDALYHDARDPVIGSKDAPFVLVEFFDYNCAYCKLASKWLKNALAEHPGKIRLVLKDFPILEGRAKGSREASEAAWAARLQGADKYRTFHFALLDARGGFDSQRIDKIAKQSGIDVKRMRADMKNNAKAFAALLDANMSLAASLDINGTPGFISGDTQIAGADTAKLQALLDAALEKAARKP